MVLCAGTVSKGERNEVPWGSLASQPTLNQWAPDLSERACLKKPLWAAPNKWAHRSTLCLHTHMNMHPCRCVSTSIPTQTVLVIPFILVKTMETELSFPGSRKKGQRLGGGVVVVVFYFFFFYFMIISSSFPTYSIIENELYYHWTNSTSKYSLLNFGLFLFCYSQKGKTLIL